MLPDELFVVVELTSSVLKTMPPVGNPPEFSIDAEFVTIVAGRNILERSPEVLATVLVMP